jgi:hypothetical protein
MNENEQIVLPQLSHDEAQEITKQIHETTERLYQLVLKAYEGQAHKALGYSSWKAYVTTEFDMSERQSYRLIDHGQVIQALTTVMIASKDYLDNQADPGVSDEIPIIEINERDTRGMKPHIEEITTELQTAIESGITPQEAVVALVDKYGAPSSNEAEELAKITGLSIAGDDNEYHSGKSAEELKESKLLTEQWMAVVNAGESIKKLPSPRRFVSSVPLFMRRSIKTNIPDSIIWLNGVQKIIDVEWKE